jgi:hypothetical protein
MLRVVPGSIPGETLLLLVCASLFGMKRKWEECGAWRNDFCEVGGCVDSEQRADIRLSLPARV